jgi:hypothetical protein
LDEDTVQCSLLGFNWHFFLTRRFIGLKSCCNDCQCNIMTITSEQPTTVSTPGITISGVTVDDNGNVVINGNLNVGDIIVGGSDIGL